MTPVPLKKCVNIPGGTVLKASIYFGTLQGICGRHGGLKTHSIVATLQGTETCREDDGEKGEREEEGR